jgi:aryl-alcohol dehydrogenase-like predicted oxidoreductase
MKYRKLGKSGLKVSEIGFGAWTIALNWWTGGKEIDDNQAIKMLKRAYDLGINFYETADMYGKGRSEKLIAQAFKGMQRDEIIYSTKWGYDMYNAEQIGHNELPQKHNDTRFLKYALQQSLNRLQTDYIDVYSLHNPKMDAIKNDDLFTSLDDLVQVGKIRSHGVALGPAIGWRDEGLLAMRKRNITCLQTVYNILEQDPGRVLTGKVNENTVFDKNDHRSSRKKEWILESMQKIEKLKNIANAKGWDMSELAIKFILSQKQVSVVLPTVIDVSEIELFAEMSDGNLLNENEISEIMDFYNNNFYLKPTPSDAIASSSNHTSTQKAD